MPNPRTTLTFLGAARTVTGSKYLLTVGERRILVDAGMFQGEKEWRVRNWEPFPVDPASLSDLVLTHAHLDHCGYLPALVKAGFRGPIWCTEGTRRLAEIVLRDAAKLQEQEAEDANTGGWSRHDPALPLYTTEDVEAALPQFVALEYDTDFELTGGERAASDPRIVLRLTRAGHILGSASATLWTPTASVVFSGDLGRHDHPVLRARDVPPGGTFVLVESTYGDREHPGPANLPHEELADVIRRTLARGGTVLIPAFAIDRTELVLKVLFELKRDGRIPDAPVYVNSPMATAALDVYQALTDELRPDVAEDFRTLTRVTAVRSAEDSKALTAAGGHGPSIIVASSGMATGGRVLHHLEQLAPDARNAIVLTGYQGVGTRGRALLEGATQLKMRGRYVPVRAEIVADAEFSVHADASDLVDWVRELSPAPRTVFCVHGEGSSAEALARRIGSELGYAAVVPRFGEVVVLDVAGPGDAPVAVAPPVPDAARRVPDAPRRVPVAARTVPVAARPVPDVPRPGRTVADAAPGRPADTAPVPETQRYRCITGPDDADFRRRVGAALAEGYVLAGGTSVTFNGHDVVLVQAVVWPDPAS